MDASRSAENIVSRLAAELVDAGSAPLDSLHAAALLEAQGWTDQRAAEYAFADVFALGAAVHSRTSQETDDVARGAPPEKRGVRRLLSVVRSYIRGMTFALPMLLLSMSVVFIHFSTVSYVRFSTAIATAIGVGTIGSFLVTGGFSQAIAHEGLFYISQGLYSLSRHFCRKVISTGLLTVVAAWIIAVLANALFQIVPLWMVGVGTVYYFLLAVLWLGASLLYMLRREPTILLLFAFSIAVVYVLFRIVHWPMMVAQAVGISAIDLGVFAAATYFFGRLESTEDPNVSLRFNRRWSAIIQVARPYFLYGAVYFAFLFIDRLVAWSAPAAYHPYVLWFQNAYELGLDWALWTFVLPMGLIEVYIDAVFHRVEARRNALTVHDVQDFNTRFVGEHSRVTLWVAVTGLLTALVVVLVLQLLSSLGILANPLVNPITRSTFLFAAPSYMLIAVALQNTLVPFSVNMVRGPLRSVTWGLAADLVIGFLCSRIFGYQWAVLGLLAGSITFALVSMSTARGVIHRLDFNLVRLL